MITQTDQLPTTFSARNTFGKGVCGGLFADQYPMRIIIAEDDAICRRVMAMFLKNLGYCPSCVNNGQECLEEVLREPFDLLLTDLDMPVMTGDECMAEIRERGMEIFIIAVTSCSKPNPAEYCLESGADAYLPKPFNGSVLKTFLREAFNDIRAKHAALA